MIMMMMTAMMIMTAISVERMLMKNDDPMSVQKMLIKNYDDDEWNYW